MILLGLFSSNSSDSDASPPPDEADSTSIISEGANIEGILDLTAVNLCIEGTVHGDISTDGRVVVAEGAEVEGTINARTIRLAGYVNGQVQAEERLVLCPTSEVHATLGADVLEIQPGADFRGDVPEDQNVEEETVVGASPPDDETKELVSASNSSPNGNGDVASS